MKHKTNELAGALLDAAVAKAEGKKIAKTPEGEDGAWIEVGWPEGRLPYAPSTNWNDGGPIIERERIKLDPDFSPEIKGDWVAMLAGGYAEGPTPLIAAMRAYVASTLGDEVEL